MPTGYPEVEEQESTRIEKVLLVALVAFLLVGSFWTLDWIESSIPEPLLQSYAEYSGSARQREGTPISVEDEIGVTPLRTEVLRLQAVATNRAASLAKAKAALDKAQTAYEFRREEYRTAMQAGASTQAQRSAFESARVAFQQATADTQPAQRASDVATKQLADEQRLLDAASKRAQDLFDSRTLQRNVKLFGLHFGFAGLCLALSWLVWQLGRKSRWRYQSILSAFFIASLAQLLFLVFRYCWELFLDEFAPLAISLMGAVVCILAIIAIKRWLFSPERLAEARLAGQRCPHCATPFSDSQTHCWHCGRPLVEKCQSCGSNRLLFAAHCGNCGAANSEQGRSRTEPS